MKAVEGSLWCIEYRGYCPAGWPKRLAEMFFVGHAPCPPEIKNFPITLGGGYAVTHIWISRPIKPYKQETLASIRKKRIERRIKKKYPLFAEQFIASGLERKPDYYNGVTDQEIEQMRSSARAEYDRTYYERIARPGVLVVFAQEPEGAKSKAAKIMAEMANAREMFAAKRKATE